MTDHPVLNRRFVRLQAVLHCYAFYVCKQANYDCALDQIRNAFVLDVFADPPVDKAQLTREVQQALALFSSAIISSGAPSAVVATSSRLVSTVVTQALASYEKELTKDTRRLQEGLTETVVKINQACVYIWQLLVEWAYIAKKQTERPKLSQQYAGSAAVCLSHSPILQYLQNDDVLAKLVQQQAASWTDHLPMVESWYNQFVKQEPAVQRYLAHPITPVQDQQLVVFLLENIVFKEKTIQTFFNDLDLKWALHKRIVKKLVHQGLPDSLQNEEKFSSFRVLSLATSWGSAQCFYTDLVRKTLQRDEELEALIAQKAENWTVDRIMMLDKTILKLALCEMLYFTEIPVKVSINEYIDLSKIYSMPKSSQFVNGLLDAVAATLHRGDGNKA